MTNDIYAIAQDNSDLYFEKYVQFATELVEDLNVPLHFLHTVSPVQTPHMTPLGHGLIPLPNLTIEKMRSRAAQRLSSLVTAHSSDEIDVDTEVEIGLTAEVVMNIDKEINPMMWLIMMRSHPSFFNEIFDSLEIRLAQQVASPIFVVPPNTSYVRPRSMVVLTSSLDNGLDSNTIKFFQQKLKVKIYYLLDAIDHEHPEGFHALPSELKSLIDNGTVTLLPDEDVFDKIQHHLERINPDWLCIQKFHRTAWEKLLSKYSLNHLLLNEHRPSLII